MHFQDELTIDMTHFSGEGWGITEEEIDACKERIHEAALSVEQIGRAGRGRTAVSCFSRICRIFWRKRS